MQYIEVVVFVELLYLWNERTKGLWVSSLGYIVIDSMDVR
jgi:hypothetical protein